MGIKRCVLSACERQREGLQAEVLKSAPEAQVGLALTLWPAMGLRPAGRMGHGDPHHALGPVKEASEFYI